MRDPRELAGSWSSFQSHGFLPPSPALRSLVARYWWARWDLTGQPAYEQLIIPYPNVHLTFSAAADPMIRGVNRGRIRRVLSGRDAVLGVAFRPGVFRRYLAAPLETVTDRSLPASAVLRDPLPQHVDVLDPAALASAVDAYLVANLPPADAVGDEVAAWVETIAESPDLRRVDQLTARFSVSERQLQRLFAEHVGVSPKWVLRRFRLHEVTSRMEARSPIDWAALAADLGYADQSHLTRDFTNMFGEPPTTYAARY
ncbi:helix-turn-helix domain-containing protein [Dactylosporangium sp. CS-047395]|uniref:AraC family transcriptional regulator n=1 Tax=Dactylosporangium sp. CS-047395 TaxID=3239936 RepID=UPI003D8FD351